MPTVELQIPALGDKFKDYRQEIYGNSYTFGPIIYAPNVQFLTFHHSVTKQTAFLDGNWKAECDAIARIHVDKNQWAGIGYHGIICSDGTVAYVSDLSHGAANVLNHNDINFGFCMVGDFTKQLPTDEQIRSAHLVAWHFLENMPSYPALQVRPGVDKLVHFNNHIRGHKDWFNPVTKDNNTACPGSSWPNDMKNRIKYGIVYTPVKPAEVVPQTPTPEPQHEEVSPHIEPAPMPPVENPVPNPSTNPTNEEVIVVTPNSATVLSEDTTPIIIPAPVLPSENPGTVYNTGGLRHIDYVKMFFAYIIKILNTKLW